LFSRYLVYEKWKLVATLVKNTNVGGATLTWAA
jgi:hypothetical protein